MSVEVCIPGEDLPLKDCDGEECEKGTDSMSDSDLSSRNSSVAGRETWERKAEFILSLVGYSVAFGNIQRFPYLCAKNGGGAFLIPFFTLLVVCGIPLYYLEVCIGKFSGYTPLQVWKFCPLFKGVGVLMVIISGVCSWYYNTLIAWSIYYLGMSFSKVLPWSQCSEWWNKHPCVTEETRNNVTYNATDIVNMTQKGNISTLVKDGLEEIQNSTVSGSWEFWQNNVLRISSGIDEPGGIQWHLVLSLFLAWLLVFLCLIKGVKSLGKVVYVTALLPYILFIAFLIRGLTLPGSLDGVLYYLTPDFNRLSHAQVWMEASIQVFFSLGPAWGGVITMASYSKFHDDCLKTAILVTTCEGLTSFMFGFAVFSTLGFMAAENHVPIEKVVSQGPGMIFITYPEAISKLPLPQLWAVLFFVMMITVGLDTEFGMFETLSSGIVDAFPKQLAKRKTLTVGIITAIFFLMGLPFTTRAGIYIYQLIDWYSAAFCLVLCAFLESFVVGWVYGAERLSRDVQLMTGSGIPIPIRLCWCIFCPVILFIVFICILVRYEAPTYNGNPYPEWSRVLGFFIGLLPGIPIPVMMARELYNAKGNVIQRFQHSLKPAADWLPCEPKYVEMYKEQEHPQYRTILEMIRMNLFGFK